METLDIYNKDRIKTGKIIGRGQPREAGEYFLAVHVCIFNSKGEMLVQQRQPFKKDWPNMWDITVGGCAVVGDTSQTAAERELFEEIGYALDLSQTRPHITINFGGGFDDYYLVEADVEIDKLALQYEEVQQVKWATEDEIIAMIEECIFIPYFESFIRSLFQMRKGYGSHSR